MTAAESTGKKFRMIKTAVSRLRRLEIVKNTEGVRYVASEWFKPSVDEPVSDFMLPRIKKFIMRDLEGNVMFDESKEFSPVFYPAN